MLKSNFSACTMEAGCDEAGRGCLAGPVVAAAVILPLHFFHPKLNDSKQLSEKTREILRQYIIDNALAYAVSFIENNVIDEINILNASILAMHNSLGMLKTKPDFIIVDGNRFKPYKNIPYQTIIKGDAQYMNIAAASILAKTYRDQFMSKIDNDYPYYNWRKNKGYPTSEHKQAILKHGLSPYHRKTFNSSIQTKLFEL